jgi:hypothetical protein
VAQRRATADRRFRILDRLPGLTVLESREIDPPAGFVSKAVSNNYRIDLMNTPLPITARHCEELLRRSNDSRAATRIAGAEFGAPGSRDKNFPGCKALKSHEMELESAGRDEDVGSAFVCAGRRPALGRAYRADRDRRARRRREASPKTLRSRLIVHLSNRGVSVAGVAAREGAWAQNGVDRKWRRNGLKTLNQRSEMVASRKPRSHKIWYAGAGLTVRSD